ncbi:MAG TPA: hypothetical protein VHL98_09610 [Microvirga sp.]|jgi:hypothetical protein|nr:hypothetical protein [Microvirga sp.]
MWDTIIAVAAVALAALTWFAVRAVLHDRSRQEEVSPWAGDEAGWSLPDAAAAPPASSVLPVPFWKTRARFEEAAAIRRAHGPHAADARRRTGAPPARRSDAEPVGARAGRPGEAPSAAFHAEVSTTLVLVRADFGRQPDHPPQPTP